MKEKVSATRESYPRVLILLQRVIFFVNDIIHAVVAIFLLLSAILMIGYSAYSFKEISSASILFLINDILFVIIIMELLWTMLSYLRRKKFPIVSFLFIGIISSIRRMLMIEAQIAIASEGVRDIVREVMELGLYAGIVFVLVVSYYILSKVPATE